jgi:galactokinase
MNIAMHSYIPEVMGETDHATVVMGETDHATEVMGETDHATVVMGGTDHAPLLSYKFKSCVKQNMHFNLKTL